MQEDGDAGICGACFRNRANIVEECFTDDMEAFARYATLSRWGASPALCQEAGNIYYVCHIRLPGEGKAAHGNAGK